MRILRSGDRIESATLYPVRSVHVEQVLLPDDPEALTAIGEIVTGESRSRLYVVPTASDGEKEVLRLCLRGTPGAVRVSGPIAAYADVLLGRTRRAMLQVAARYRDAGDEVEALRWKQMPRRLLISKRSVGRGKGASVRSVSGGLPTLGKRR